MFELHICSVPTGGFDVFLLCRDSSYCTSMSTSFKSRMRLIKNVSFAITFRRSLHSWEKFLDGNEAYGRIYSKDELLDLLNSQQTCDWVSQLANDSLQNSFKRVTLNAIQHSSPWVINKATFCLIKCTKFTRNHLIVAQNCQHKLRISQEM